MTINSKIVQALTLIGNVHNCHQLKENEDITDHYDCQNDIDEAIKILQEVQESIND